MKARTKFLTGGALILSTAGYLMASSISETAVYYLTPTELASKLGDDPTFRNVGVKVGANVVSGSIVRDPGGRSVSFEITDGAHTYPVVYRGLAPDTFSDGVEVVVEGRLGADGVFHASTLLAKCASRYENAPDGSGGGYQAAPEGGGYQRSPGYQTGQGKA